MSHTRVSLAKPIEPHFVKMARKRVLRAQMPSPDPNKWPSRLRKYLTSTRWWPAGKARNVPMGKR